MLLNWERCQAWEQGPAELVLIETSSNTALPFVALIQGDKESVGLMHTIQCINPVQLTPQNQIQQSMDVHLDIHGYQNFSTSTLG